MFVGAHTFTCMAPDNASLEMIQGPDCSGVCASVFTEELLWLVVA